MGVNLVHIPDDCHTSYEIWTSFLKRLRSANTAAEQAAGFETEHQIGETQAADRGMDARKPIRRAETLLDSDPLASALEQGAPEGAAILETGWKPETGAWGPR